MQYLVQMKLADHNRPTTAEEEAALLDEFMFPTLELCKRLKSEKKILAGGPMSGAVALVLIVDVESTRQLDDLITSLPVWSRMETEVTPLTSFEGRALTMGKGRLEKLRARVLQAV